jgi:hypothetical protein
MAACRCAKDGAWIGKTTRPDGKKASEKRKLLFNSS